MSQHNVRKMPTKPKQNIRVQVPHGDDDTSYSDSATDDVVVYDGHTEELMDVKNPAKVVMPSKDPRDDTGIYDETKATPEHEKLVPNMLVACVVILISEIVLIILYCVFFVPHIKEKEKRYSDHVLHALVLFICDILGCIAGFAAACLGFLGSWHKQHWTKQILFTHICICGLCVNLVLCVVSGVYGMFLLPSIIYVFAIVLVVDFSLYSITIYFGIERVKAIKRYMASTTTN
jgi:hypothetical protein